MYRKRFSLVDAGHLQRREFWRSFLRSRASIALRHFETHPTGATMRTKPPSPDKSGAVFLGSIPTPNHRLTRPTCLLMIIGMFFVAGPSRGQAGPMQSDTSSSSASASAHDLSDPPHPSQASVHDTTEADSESVPLGAAPLPGQAWHVQANDDFAQDNSINQSLWNGGTGGGMPPGFCHTPATSCGYTGDDCNSYFGTYPEPPFETIVPGQGLVIQATHAAPGDLKYYDNKIADIQSYGKITIHPGYFVEWQARMPTDRHGEGDGWHVDLWCTTLSRNRCDDSAEVDVAEKVLSVADSAETHFTVHDQPTGLQTVIETTYSAPGSPDLSAAFHTYGLFWRDDPLGKQGALEAYIDGKPIVNHPVPINDPSWGGGAYCYAGWMQQELAVWGGGVSNNAHTSSNDPLYIRRFKVWKSF
jgi:hypothetical protein